MKKKGRNFEPLLNALSEGQTNAIHMAHLAIRLGITERSLRALVHDARLAGHAICSGDEGYFLPACPADEQRTFFRSRSMGLSILATTTPSRRRMKAGGIVLDKKPDSLIDG